MATMMMRLGELCATVNGHRQGADVAFGSVSIDSRTLRTGELFVALSGDHYDGGRFVKQAKEQGAIAALVNEKSSEDLPQVVVRNTLKALGKLANAWRLRLNPLVTAITGSNGKTTTKELLATVLASQAPVLYTYGNLNNDIGVPLTLLRLSEEHRFAVIEMGANHPGEIGYVGEIARPDIAVITNAAPAHLEGFKTIAGVAKAKGELIATVSDQGTVILNADDDYFDMWKGAAEYKHMLSFGFSEQADVRAVPASSDSTRVRFDLQYAGNLYPLRLKLLGRHNISNALAATAAGIVAGLPVEQIRDALDTVNPVGGRSQQCRGINGSTIINDSYNANPTSFKAALEVLKDFDGKRWLVLGAFAELGEDSAKFHHDLGLEAKMAGIERLFTVGEDTRNTVDEFGRGAQYFDQHADLIEVVKQQIDHRTVVLIKGSRSQHMEVVVDALTNHDAEA